MDPTNSSAVECRYVAEVCRTFLGVVRDYKIALANDYPQTLVYGLRQRHQALVDELKKLAADGGSCSGGVHATIGWETVREKLASLGDPWSSETEATIRHAETLLDPGEEALLATVAKAEKKPRGKPPSKFTKQRLDFTTPRVNGGKSWPEITAEYRDVYPADKIADDTLRHLFNDQNQKAAGRAKSRSRRR